MNTKVIFSEKGKELLLVNNYKFCKDTLHKNGNQPWRCVNKSSKCPAKVLTAGNDVILSSKLEHNHQPDSTLLRQITSNNLKRKAVENINERPIKLIRQDLKKGSADIAIEDIDRFRKNMYHARRKQLPALPKTRNEVHEYIESANLTTSAGDPFLLINNKNNGLIVFATFLNFHFLANCDTVYMDGTFNYCTQFFYQFFTIHGYHNGFYIPLLFCLLPGKQHENYLILFNSIKTKAELNGLVFQPSKIVVDFELAIHSALREVWQDAEIIGCRFHLGQAWFRKIQSLGLASEFNNPNSDIGKHLKYFFGLSFLEPLVVSDGFLLLLEDMPQDERITKFCDYLVENYIKEDALFPPELWAAASWSLSRTTNACESFHSHFADNFYRSHPNIFQFINVLLDIQLTTSAKISSARKGRKLVRAQYRRTEQLLRTKTEEYTSNRISMLDFIKYMAYRFTSHPRM